MPGVRMSNTDVGGNQQMEQIYMTVNGSRQTDTTVQVDGMKLNSLMNDGQVQAYFSDAAMAEITYQTSGITADVSTGGVRINMIPKDGGNVFSGQAFVGGTDGAWQADNVTDELRARGLTQRVARREDQRLQLRPRRSDQEGQAVVLRQLAAHRHRLDHSGQLLRDTGEVGTGIEDQWIQNQMVRLTWQINQKNKFSVYHDRYPKFKGHELIAGSISEWDTAAGRRNPEHALYYTGQAKWTSTSATGCCSRRATRPTSSTYIGYQPGVQQERGTPDVVQPRSARTT